MAFLEWLKKMFTDMFSGMDWAQFIPSLIATFVGIFVPFWLQSRLEKKQKRNDAIHWIAQIKSELEDVKKIIIKRENLCKDGNIFISPLPTPIWDSLLRTNEMSLLVDLQKFQSRKARRQKNQSISDVFNWCKMISDVYGEISNYNLLQSKYAEQAFYLKNNFLSIENEKKLLAKEHDVHKEQEAVRRNQADTVLQIIRRSRVSVAEWLVGEIPYEKKEQADTSTQSNDEKKEQADTSTQSNDENKKKGDGSIKILSNILQQTLTVNQTMEKEE